MSLNSSDMQRIIDLGGDANSFVNAARFLESRRGGREAFECLLAAFEVPGATPFAEAFPKIVDALIPKPRDAANDPPARMNTYQRRVAYANLVDRDGEVCAECGAGSFVVWRRMGVWATSLEDGARYTKVHPTSNLEVDHKTPLWAGGDNSLPNLWLLCIDCHKKKTSREASERRRA